MCLSAIQGMMMNDIIGDFCLNATYCERQNDWPRSSLNVASEPVLLLLVLLCNTNDGLSHHHFAYQYRPLIWRNTHPYVVVDRHEDITDPNRVDADENCERSIALYGYVRGTHLKPNMKVHLIGVGDFDMQSIRMIPDPLPVANHDETQKTVRT